MSDPIDAADAQAGISTGFTVTQPSLNAYPSY